MEPTSRKYTWEEVVERMRKPIRQYRFPLAIDEEDFLYEDTYDVARLAMPRLFWKMVYALSQESGFPPQVIIEELICDRLWDLHSTELTKTLFELGGIGYACSKGA